MAQFKYKAKTAAGATETGTADAESIIELRKIMLKDKNLYLISAEEIRSKSFTGKRDKKVSLKDLSMICKQLNSMLGAGVTLVRSMDILYQQTADPKLKETLRDIYEDVQKGSMFSDALRKQGECFPPLMISIVQSGEASGNLEEVIGKLASQFEADNRIRQQVVSATVYPAVLLVLILAAVVVLLVFVMPTFVGMFTSSGVALPVPTQIVLNSSNFLVKWWYLVFPLLGIAIYVFTRWIKTPKGNYFKSKAYLKLPIVKETVINIASARFSRTLANLISSGLPLINSIEITSKVVGNAIIENALMEMRDDIRVGMNLSYGIKKINVFPPVVHSMIAIGEESGDIDSLLDKLADFMDEEVATSIARLMTMLEPLLIVFMGGVVGFIVVAMILPIFGVYETI
ncbi:MAG: type II secretion system F family protein [Clostridiales bacterium]|jgi:type IV pilus assembly protein PilC|nr:type II secretion system F family protein [Clostridiales bacterium]